METSGKVNNCGICSCQFVPQKVTQHVHAPHGTWEKHTKDPKWEAGLLLLLLF